MKKRMPKKQKSGLLILLLAVILTASLPLTVFAAYTGSWNGYSYWVCDDHVPLTRLQFFSNYGYGGEIGENGSGEYYISQDAISELGEYKRLDVNLAINTERDLLMLCAGTDQSLGDPITSLLLRDKNEVMPADIKDKYDPVKGLFDYLYVREAGFGYTGFPAEEFDSDYWDDDPGKDWPAAQNYLYTSSEKADEYVYMVTLCVGQKSTDIDDKPVPHIENGKIVSDEPVNVARSGETPLYLYYSTKPFSKNYTGTMLFVDTVFSMPNIAIISGVLIVCSIVVSVLVTRCVVKKKYTSKTPKE